MRVGITGGVKATVRSRADIVPGRGVKHELAVSGGVSGPTRWATHSQGLHERRGGLRWSVNSPRWLGKRLGVAPCPPDRAAEVYP
jgi:hypothetical protein